MEQMIVGAGIVCMVAGLIGGDIHGFGLKFPPLRSGFVQAMVILLGAGFLVLGLSHPWTESTGGGSSATGSTGTAIAGTGPTEAVPSEQPKQSSSIAAQTETPKEPPKDVPPAATGYPANMAPLEFGVNYDQSDLDPYGRAADNADQCAKFCSENDQCVAMTYVVSQRNCWLKKAPLPSVVGNPDMISAVKTK